MISVVMIVLNNIATIKPCLASLTFADEIVIVDGGSTDGTVQTILDYRHERPIRLYHHPWPNHFGEQRQWSFLHASWHEEQWWVRIDSDEIAPAIFREHIRPLLEGLPPQIQACRIKQYNLVESKEMYSAALGGWETHPRCWRANRRLRWVGQVHESVYKPDRDGNLAPIPETEIANLNLGIIHQGWLYQEAMAQKEQQYMDMDGSGFTQEGDLTGRHHEVRRLPLCLTNFA